VENETEMCKSGQTTWTRNVHYSAMNTWSAQLYDTTAMRYNSSCLHIYDKTLWVGGVYSNDLSIVNLP